MIKFIGNVVLSVAEYLLDAYVLTLLWGWFIATTFHFPALTLYSAMGLLLVVGYMTKQVDWYVEKVEDLEFKRHVVGVAKPLAALLIGWSIKVCM